MTTTTTENNDRLTWDARLFEAVRAVTKANAEMAKAQQALDQLRLERNIALYPIETEVVDGEVKVMFPSELGQQRFPLHDVQIFVQRVKAFRAASGL